MRVVLKQIAGDEFEVDLSDASMRGLYLTDNRIVDIENLDISELKDLEVLELALNALTEVKGLDLSNNAKLTRLVLSSNIIDDISELDLSANTSLINLE